MYIFCMSKVFFIILIFSFIFSDDYIFSENIRITESSNDQKFPEIAIDENIIHLTWVSILGNNKNIIYSKSENYGESFSDPIQINYVNNNIIAYGQSGPKISIYNAKVYITYTDNRSGITSVYLNMSKINIKYPEEFKEIMSDLTDKAEVNIDMLRLITKKFKVSSFDFRFKE